MFSAFHQNVDDLGVQITEDWREHPSVVDASYLYVHGIDSGDQLHLRVTLDAAQVTDEVTAEIEEIATEDYWRSDVAYVNGGVQIRVFSSDQPFVVGPGDQVENPQDSVEEIAITFDPTDEARIAELEAVYGPRPTPAAS